MFDITAPCIPTPLVTAATDGYATLEKLNNWVHRRTLNTPTEYYPEPRAGKPRQFALLAVYEIAMISWACRKGIPLQVMTTAFNFRKRQALSVNASGWTDTDFEAIAKAGQLEEFAYPPVSNPIHWVISVIKADGETFASGRFTTKTEEELGEGALSVIEKGGFPVIINVTAIVKDVHSHLEAAGWKLPN